MSLRLVDGRPHEARDDTRTARVANNLREELFERVRVRGEQLLRPSEEIGERPVTEPVVGHGYSITRGPDSRVLIERDQTRLRADHASLLRSRRRLGGTSTPTLSRTAFMRSPSSTRPCFRMASPRLHDDPDGDLVERRVPGRLIYRHPVPGNPRAARH